MVHSQQRLDRRNLSQPACEIVNLVEALDVTLVEQKTGRLDRVKQSSSFGIGLRSLKTDDEKLAYFLFKGEMRIPHWNQFGLQAFYSAFFLNSARSRNASSGVRV